MCAFKVENQSNGTYLVYEIGGNDTLDTTSLGMLTNNSIPGFAPASFMQMDDKKYIKYNVSSRAAVSQLFNGPVNRKRLIGVLTGIVDALLSADDYMLDPQTLILDLDYIYADVASSDTVLICLPLIQEGGRGLDLEAFFKNIIFTTQFDQTENCDHVAQILNYLNRASILSLQEFKDLLNRFGTNAAPVSAEPQPMTEGRAVQSFPVINSTNLQNEQPKVTSQQVPEQPTFPDTPRGDVITGQNEGKIENRELKFGPNYDPAAKSEAQEEKPMSRFYLLQHYNKENAAIFKAQQQAKKARKNSGEEQNVPAKNAPRKNVPQKNVPQKNVPQKSVPQKNVPQKNVPPKNGASANVLPRDAAQRNVPLQKKGYDVPGAKENSWMLGKKDTDVGSGAGQSANMSATQRTIPAGYMNFGETVILNQEEPGGTTILTNENHSPVVYLVRLKNSERIMVPNKPTFKIGRERAYVDYAVEGNSNISRSHAVIINRDGVFFVKDTNSSNGTYVNGVRCLKERDVPIQSGSRIRFADEEFEFVIQ